MGRALRWSAVALALFCAATVSTARAQTEIKIGDISSYSAFPAFTDPYRKGWQLAVEEINAAGGVLGKKFLVISKDDAAKPAEAVTAANELVSREGVALLSGTYFSNIGLAVADFAKQKKVFFLASEPLSDAVTMSKGNHYTFRLRPSTYMQGAMLIDEAVKLPAKRWAAVAPNFEYGQAMVAAFKQLLAAKRPDVEWVSEQWPALGNVDAGAITQIISEAKPDALLNVLFGADNVKLVREGNTRGTFKNLAVVGPLLGEPEYLDPVGSETPSGWIVTGYPWYSVDTPDHTAFLKAYQAKFNDYPRVGSLVGYMTLKAVAAIIAKAGSTDTEKMIAAAEGVAFPSPLGPVHFRASDHQATMGAYVGKTALKDGKGVMVDWHYADGANYLPSEEEVKKVRPRD
ncbi:MAG: ABC transporter substrate-binding protein [Pseudomonadota bacterium]